MRNYSLLCPLLLGLGYFVSVSFAFAEWHLDGRTQSRTKRASSLSSDIYLLSFDAVAKTTEWRIAQGMEAAFSVWPKLREASVIADGDEWLRNKMRAVSSILVSRPGCSVSCDYALLTRLLIEEQELDQGRSNGCSGKYGSKFHPQTLTPSIAAQPGSRGSRPLTGECGLTPPSVERYEWETIIDPIFSIIYIQHKVGEIAENWDKGGCLAETLLTKYHIDYENPLTALQERISTFDESVRLRFMTNLNCD